MRSYALLLVLAAFLFTSCGGGGLEEKLIGTWKAAATLEDGERTEMPAGTDAAQLPTLVVNADGTMTFTVFGQVMASTYKVTGSTGTSLTIENTTVAGEGEEPKVDTTTITFVDDNTITVTSTEDDTVMEFVRHTVE